jgi:hypothetical protein
LFIGIGCDGAADRYDGDGAKATLRMSRVVQGIADQEGRECYIELGRELGKAERGNRT